MYGISNSQQQGGGGGSAASYKAIKSTIAPSDWQEVVKQPYFVGENATQWTIDSTFGTPAKRSETVIGIISGADYTMSVTVDGQVYTKTAQMVDPSETGGNKVLMFYFAGVGDDGSINEDELIAVQILDDVSTMLPGVGSVVAVKVPTTVTSLIITSFTGPGLSSGGKTTISDSAIKVNSAVTLYTNTSEKIAAVEKTDGSVTLTAPSIPTTEIPYSLEIVGTDSEGLFELINGYVPDISDIPTVEIPTSLPQKTSDTKVATWRKGESSMQVNDSDITETSDIVVEISCEKEVVGNISTGIFILRFYDYPSPDEDISFTYKVKQTDGKGQLVIVNRYVPSVPSTFVESVNGKSGVVTVSKIKTITNTSTNITITRAHSPYLCTVFDDDVKTSSFVRLYPADDVTEAWLNENTLSGVITELSGRFTFQVGVNALPTSFNMKYIIESPQ